MWSFNTDNYHKCKNLTLLAYTICHLYVLVCLAMNFHYLLPPATKLGQGYVFTGVCDSVHRRVSASVQAGIPHPPWSRHPSGADTPLEQTPPRADTPPPEQTLPRVNTPPHQIRHPWSRHSPEQKVNRK